MFTVAPVVYGWIMTSVPAAAALSPKETSSFERRIFEASPIGAVATATTIFVVGVGTFLLVAWLVHYPLIGPNGAAILPALMPGITLPLLLATALGMNRYADVGQRADLGALAAIVPGDAAAAVVRPVSSNHSRIPGIAGGVAGALICFLSVPRSVLFGYPAVYAWFAAVIILLSVMFARGIVDARRREQKLSALVDHDLQIDLLHADKLSVIGRQSARNALVWFVIAAVVCLFFVGGKSSATTPPLLLVTAAVGLWAFLQPMVRVHHRIRSAKSAELDHVRDQIGEARAAEARDVMAAARLPGLLAYEGRIQAVREWPFDQSTLIRVVTYVLIPTIPWIGEAVVSDLLRQLAH